MENVRGAWTFLILANIFVIIRCSWPLSSCKDKRTIYTAQNGTVASGVGSEGTYTNFSRCEWLIDAGGTNKSIVLEFRKMDTECSYDFLFIFDGHSYNSKLLASVSGNTDPEPIVARSGFMLIYLFTDRNYNRDGFLADYKIQDCAFNCHGRGSCVNNRCHCNSYYKGVDCELRICPNSCGFGDCKTIGGKKICKCNGGVMGEGCDLPIHGRNGTGMWYRLAPSMETFTPRTSHAGVFVREEECLYVYGGYTLNDVLGDLLRFCVRNSQWEAVEPNDENDFWPLARKEHRMVKYKDGFYVFGGMHSDGSHCNELLFYNLTSQTWTQKAQNSSVQPHRLTGHSLTLVNDWLYVIGGKMEHGLFSSSIYRYNLNSTEDQWEEVYLKGGRPVQQLLVGHTAVYHKESRSIIVFGGYSALQARFAKLSSRLFMLNVETLYWGEVEYPAKQQVYSPDSIQRAYHSASIMGNYMVIYGGNVHMHNSIETCYDHKIHLYHLGCHQWIKHPGVHSHSAASNGEPKKGRFGHVAVPAYNNVLLIIGGYSGYVRGDLVAYKFHGVVSPPENEEDKDLDHCENYADPQHERCPKDPECAFCTEKRDTRMPGCVHRTRLDKCADSRHIWMYNCSGLCHALHTCQSCLTHGHAVTLTEKSPKHRFYQHECVWCIHNSTCLPKSANACSRSESSNNLGIMGWWNGSNTKWDDVDQCSLDEIPAGVQMVIRYNPANSEQPDEVKILHTVKEDFDYKLYKGKTDGHLHITLTGFIHPLAATPIYGTDKLRVFLIAASLPSVLQFSNDSSKEKLEVVSIINKTNTPGDRSVEAIRKASKPIFPNTARGYKYYFNIKGTSDMNEKENATVSLEWNIANTGFVMGKQTRRFALEFLEPYHSPNCSRHHNCLACMSNAECGWCPFTDTCDHKGSNSSLSSCVGPDLQAYLITQPMDCVQCPDYVDCHSCASDKLCEWITKDVRCTRRWRVHSMIQDPDNCPVECHRRMTCNSCILPNSECFWCENTGTCLPFAHYISRFVNGQCREWMDSEGIESYSCKNCSAHTVCESCLDTYGCGWCSDPDNPSIGRCVDGDFAGPYHGQNCTAIIHEVQNRTAIIHEVQNGTELLPADWSYHRCPDLNECVLGFHDCHENATCENIHGSYLCHCNRGFKGDGRNCQKTCHYTCVYGNCSEAPDYECRCKLGYTGPDCNTNCECNLHSTCSKGVGQCDECQHNTVGLNCEKCTPGYHGDPANKRGCKPCQCNGHGDEELGLCSSTGQCYCIDHTTGDHCEVCEDGHYGNPINGSHCYRSCDTPTVLNSTSGYIGSYRGTGVRDWHAYCIWIIAPLSGDTLKPVRGDSQYDTPAINITIEDIDTDCGWDYVYVYDGIPHFIDGNEDAWGTLLGVFCGKKAGYSVLAKSRIVTIYFETDISKRHRVPGFNASYHMNKCPTVCPTNKVCEGDRCICESGHDGPDCDNYICTDNCTFIEDKYSCRCQANFDGGANYTIELLPWFYQAVPRLRGLFGQWNRYGHTLTACGDELIYMFGGHSLEKGLLNDLWVFNITKNKWNQIMPITIDEPEGRYYHSAACIPIKRQLFIYGGFIKDRASTQDSDGTQDTAGNQKYRTKYRASNELWSFSIGGRKWTRMSVQALVKPVAGHTMTRIEETQLLIIGGFSTENYFSNKIYKFDTNVEHGKAWSEYGRGSLDGAVPLGLYGHTAVYHEQTNAIYVYGGMLFHIDKFSVSNQLYVLNLEGDRMEWNVLQAEEGSEMDARFLHTAVDMGDYMVVMGGRTDSSNFSNSILIYRYLCNYWHKFDLGDLAFSRPLHSVVAPSSAVVNNSIYVMGGLDHFVHSEVIKLDLPSDVCSLIGDLNRCINSSGCSACILSSPGVQNRTFCYSNSHPEPPLCEAAHVTVITGEQCSLQWHLERSCYQYKSCSQCLATFPHFKQNSKACKWCTNCPQGKCIPYGGECKLENECDSSLLNQVKLQAGQCEEFSCTASDCDKCQAHSCEWSNKIKRQAEMTLILAGNQPFEWGCFLSQTVTDDRFQYSTSQSLDVCPARCHTYTTCTSCLKSIGSEGGSKECIWSEMQQECMPPAYHHLHCAGGECGLIIQSTRTKCPRPCGEYSWCSDCLQAPGCGWCAFLGLNGKGVCMKGGVNSPIGGRCDAQTVKPDEGELSDEDKPFLRLSQGPPQWVFTKCLSENECLNKHHNCDDERQRCIDQPKGFRCECKNGYLWKESKGICEPVCHEGCVHGVCDAPDHCTCDFGWVGNDCSTKCMCNGYSKCRSAEKYKECLGCVNNTLGDHCEYCEKLYVGSPKDKKPCVPCLEHCHNHTPNCTFGGSFNNHSYSQYYWDSKYPNHGPKEEDALCLNCMYNTEGRRCEKCMEGYFRVEKEKKTAFDKCIKCQCHGHSDMCDSKSGLNCRCANNTESPCQSQKIDKESVDKCWQKQCSACKEYFLGTPTNGHHCYRQMTVDRDYCLDPDTQKNCNQNPGPLLRGRTVFFAVQPRYLNVDIRVTIDITKGGVDIYFSSSDQTFIVDVSKNNGSHSIKLDPSLATDMTFPNPHDVQHGGRHRRSVQNSSSHRWHDVIELKANDFHTYHTVKMTHTILIIQNVQSRVVITLPLELGLKTSKFYVVMRGRGGPTSNETYGNLYFRQDQTHIDLFVFFSVFFSSFFLFLAMCVLLWKLKQAIDAQRSRRERAKEMMHMASRPFARVLILIEPEPMPFVSTPLPRRTKYMKLSNRTTGLALTPVETLQVPFQPMAKEEHPFDVVAMAIEPTDDGISAVRTLMFQMPGGPTVPTKLCLGSTLTLSVRAAMMGMKVSSRRRPSSTVC